MLTFDGSYKNYFQWILNEFDAQKKTTFDIFFNKNTKYLVYCYNDYQNSVGESLIKIGHSHHFNLTRSFYYQRLKTLLLLKKLIA